MGYHVHPTYYTEKREKASSVKVLVIILECSLFQDLEEGN